MPASIKVYLLIIMAHSKLTGHSQPQSLNDTELWAWVSTVVGSSTQSSNKFLHRISSGLSETLAAFSPPWGRGHHFVSKEDRILSSLEDGERDRGAGKQNLLEITGLPVGPKGKETCDPKSVSPISLVALWRGSRD